jgi:CheY-like chemotaxis protein
LLLDVHLPNANGLDVLAQVRANVETNDLSVVMTSGLNLEDECLRSGANGFLLKPYMPDDLLSLLKRSLSQS